MMVVPVLCSSGGPVPRLFAPDCSGLGRGVQRMVI